jgi:hypothetical protein
MAGEVLTKMVLKAQRNGLLVDLAPDLILSGIAILQYANMRMMRHLSLMTMIRQLI